LLSGLHAAVHPAEERLGERPGLLPLAHELEPLTDKLLPPCLASGTCVCRCMSVRQGRRRTAEGKCIRRSVRAAAPVCVWVGGCVYVRVSRAVSKWSTRENVNTYAAPSSLGEPHRLCVCACVASEQKTHGREVNAYVAQRSARGCPPG
jgi:hypothetical protein